MPPAADNYAPVGFSFAKIAKTFQCAVMTLCPESNSADPDSANHAVQSKAYKTAVVSTSMPN